MNPPRKLHFRTHAELKNVIGQDLINDDNIAIIELVKNSIDAGASRISLSFEVAAPTGAAIEAPYIVILDNGSGMTLQDLEEKWLNIAYSEKKHQRSAAKVLAGNKGVGRFACDRLGTRLDLYTRTRSAPLQHLNVDWTAFEKKVGVQETIQKVNVLHREVTPAQMEKDVGFSLRTKGTALVISGVRHPWYRERLQQLKRNLQRFMNPIGALEQRSLEVELLAPEQQLDDAAAEPHEVVNGPVQNQILEKLKFKTTYVNMQLDDSGSLLTTELFHEGQRVYRLVEERTDFAPLRGVSVILHYMNAYKKAYFKRETGLHSVDFGSVFLFLNAYRVSPYGDRDNDWLQVDSRKSGGVNRFFGARDILGYVDIRDKDSEIRVVSNREGVVRNEAFARLASRDGLFFTALTRLERFVVGGLNWDSVPEHLRKRLQGGGLPGDGSMPESEVYDESADMKRRRIAMDMLRIVGATAGTARELDIDGEILDTLVREKQEDVRSVLEKFNAFDQVIGQDMRLAIGRIQREFEAQRERLQQSQQQASRKGRQVERLKAVARGISKKNVDLERRVRTQESQILFARVSATTDQEQLLLLHHQAGINAETAKNFLETALGQLRKGSLDTATKTIERALNLTNKIVKITNFATKANFRLRTALLTADIANFIEEYLLNVAKDASAQNLRLSVKRNFEEPFVMRFKPIELAIVFDNLASNSTRARARTLSVSLSCPQDNELLIEVDDDGDGLSPEIQPPEEAFERGVTTTKGSGLGLYHVRDTINQMGGTVKLREGEEAGFGLVIRLFK